MSFSRKDFIHLRRSGNEFVNAVENEVDSCIFLKDLGRLDRLITAVHNHLVSELVRSLRAKGFDKEIRQLCDKAGRGFQHFPSNKVKRIDTFSQQVDNTRKRKSGRTNKAR